MITKNGLPPGEKKKKSSMETEDHTKRKKMRMKTGNMGWQAKRLTF